MKDWLKYTGIAAIVFSCIIGLIGIIRYGGEYVITHFSTNETLIGGGVFIFILLIFMIRDLDQTSKRVEKESKERIDKNNYPYP
jgi:hypothetical protein